MSILVLLNKNQDISPELAHKKRFVGNDNLSYFSLIKANLMRTMSISVVRDSENTNDKCILPYSKPYSHPPIYDSHTVYT